MSQVTVQQVLTLVAVRGTVPLTATMSACWHPRCHPKDLAPVAVANDDDINDIHGQGGPHGQRGSHSNPGAGDGGAPPRAQPGTSETRDTKRPVAQSTGNNGRHAHAHTQMTIQGRTFHFYHLPFLHACTHMRRPRARHWLCWLDPIVLYNEQAREARLTVQKATDANRVLTPHMCPISSAGCH